MEKGSSLKSLYPIIAEGKMLAVSSPGKLLLSGFEPILAVEVQELCFKLTVRCCGLLIQMLYNLFCLGEVAQSVKRPSKVPGHGATLLDSSYVGSIPGAAPRHRRWEKYREKYDPISAIICEAELSARYGKKVCWVDDIAVDELRRPDLF